MPTPQPFAEKLTSAILGKRSPACVGLDPRPDWLPNEYRRSLHLRPTRESIARALGDFHRRILNRIAPLVPAVKPQLAFFEQLGAPGIAAFEALVEHARSLGLIIIADAKRGDIGPTAQAYARAFLGGATYGQCDISPPPSDAVTIQSYFGYDGAEPFINVCDRNGSGVFVLVRTSNPTSKELQSLRIDSVTLAERVASVVRTWSDARVGPSGYSCVGAVVGATHSGELANFRRLLPSSYFLLPGYGAQGARADDVVDAFDKRGLGGLVAASRSINFAYRRPDGTEAPDWLGAVENATKQMNLDIASALSRAGKGYRP